MKSYDLKYEFFSIILWLYGMDGDLGRTGRRSPKTFEVGDGQCICPPNIWGSSVMGCAGKYEVTKKR